MDTKEKTRQSGERPAAAGERRKRPESRRDPRRQKEAPEARPRRQKPPAEDDRQMGRRQPADRRPERASRPEQTRQPERPRRQTAEERPAREGNSASRPPQRQQEVPISAPKGTGPRKSAPQLSEQQAKALRRRMGSTAPARRPAQKNNALQDFISGIRQGKNPGEDAARLARQRREERAERAERKRQRDQRNDTPAVIYTQPMAFNRDRLLIQLLTVTAVVAALILGMSVFFKVKTIMVSGAETYSAWAVREASGISEGDGLLTFSKARAGAKIRASLAYVDDVRIGIKLPDTVIIYIDEMAVSYAVESTQGDWWLINSDGRVVEQTTASAASSHTKVLGVKLDSPQAGNDAMAADEIPQETLESGETVPLAISGAQRLSSALQILKALEANDIVGQAASVDVSSLEDVTLWYGTRYEVMLGDTANMEYKIACMNDAILDLSEYQSGILDISFRTWTDQVGYTPFG